MDRESGALATRGAPEHEAGIVAQAGAAAVLAGLVFVGVSISAWRCSPSACSHGSTSGGAQRDVVRKLEPRHRTLFSLNIGLG